MRTLKSAGSAYALRFFDSSFVPALQLVPMGGLGILLYSAKGLKGRFQATGSYGTAYGFSMNSVRFNASIQTSFP